MISLKVLIFISLAAHNIRQTLIAVNYHVQTGLIAINARVGVI